MVPWGCRNEVSVCIWASLAIGAQWSSRLRLVLPLTGWQVCPTEKAILPRAKKVPYLKSCYVVLSQVSSQFFLHRLGESFVKTHLVFYFHRWTEGVGFSLRSFWHLQWSQSPCLMPGSAACCRSTPWIKNDGSWEGLWRVISKCVCVLNSFIWKLYFHSHCEPTIDLVSVGDTQSLNLSVFK